MSAEEIQIFPTINFRAPQVNEENLPENPTAEFLANLVCNYFYCYYQDKRMFVMEYLIKNTTPERIQDIVTSLGFGHLRDTIEVFYDLLWYYNIAALTNGELSNEEKNDISRYEVDRLLQIANEQGGNYVGYTSKAALLFAISTGFSCPIPNQNQRRTRDVTDYPPFVVWDLSLYLYDFTNEDNNPQILSPHQFLLTQPDSTIENIAAVFNENTTERLSNHLGIVLPRNFEGNMTQFIFDELKQYPAIFDRDRSIIDRIPNLKLLLRIGGPFREDVREQNRKEVIRIFNLYTLKELIDFYEPSSWDWNVREQLYQIIIQDSGARRLWTKRNKWCNNDNTNNLATGIRHGDTNKNDLENPTYSYGKQRDYSCYQADELEEGWGDRGDGWEFIVPDWDPNNQNKIRYFPMDDIQVLKQILDGEQQTENVVSLNEKIELGFEAANASNRFLQRLKETYDTFSIEQKNQVNLYFGWVFQLGMFARYWKGLGYAYPTHWTENTSEEDYNTREERVIVQIQLKDDLLETFDQNVRDFIENIPLITRDANSQRYKISAGTIEQYVMAIQGAALCIAQASDKLLTTAGYLARIFIEQDVNVLIQNTLLDLLQLEKDSELFIPSEVDRIKRIEHIDRVLATPANIIIQNYNPSAFQQTQHIDPEMGCQMDFS